MKTNLSFILLISLFGLCFKTYAQEPGKSDKQILTELDKKKPAEEKKPTITKASAGSEKTGTTAFDMKAHTDSLVQLQKKSEELVGMAQKVRNDAKGKNESVKKLLLSEASNLDKQSQQVQIAASELSARISNYKFNQNKTAIKGYVNKTGEANVPVYTKNLIFDSEKIMRLAKEMREEANAQPNLASKLGTMGNAEEQESLALSKQVEALTQLERASQGAISGH
jgi:hypothetical protein